MTNKERLYWTLQLGGWAAYLAIQLVTSYLASEGIGSTRVVFLFFEAFLCIVLTHLYRNYINQRRWLSMTMSRLIPHVLVAVFAMSFTIYLFRIPVSMVLGLFNAATSFDTERLVSGVLFYALIFFLWSVLHFIYNYFERYKQVAETGSIGEGNRIKQFEVTA